MAPEIQAHIFEPFFSGSAAGNGIGLGLSVVHGIVEQSGGWIEVTSALELGTTFELYVPTQESAPAPSAARPALPVQRQPTLLLVEDEPAVRRLAVRSLERQGYRVLQAGSAEEALALLPAVSEPLDLLVTDVVLPGMNGRHLASVLLEQHPSLTVLYTSGYTDDEVLRLGVTESKLAFLQKPYTTKLLVERVDELLAARTPAR